MYTRDSAILSTYINRIITDQGSTLGSFFTTFSEYVQKLFSNGEQGFFYDPNDLSTMFQDAAGTVPVTAVGQPVGLIRDKSGRNNHAFQTTSASRPILRQNATTGAYYLEFDGSDDFLQTNNIDFTGTDKVSLFAGVRKLSDANTGIVAEFSGSSTNNISSFTMYAPATAASPGFGFRSRGANSPHTNGDSYASSPLSPVSTVLTGFGGISTDTSILRINSVQSAQSSLDQGTGNYGNYPLYIGRRNGSQFPFTGHIYSLIGVGRLATESETTTIEKELAKRLGVTI